MIMQQFLSTYVKNIMVFWNICCINENHIHSMYVEHLSAIIVYLTTPPLKYTYLSEVDDIYIFKMFHTQNYKTWQFFSHWTDLEIIYL